MTTARSNWDAAQARINAMIATYHQERGTARAPHHAGCTLPSDHEGDCSVSRGGVRRCMKLPLIGGAIIMALAILSGCNARTVSSPDAPDANRPEYTIARCGDFTGYAALIAAHCDEGDVVLRKVCNVGAEDASIDVDQGALDNGWECGTTWPDSAKGGRLCVNITCGAPHPSGGAR